MSQVMSRNMESLPRQFVSAMRTLFDIMDDKHTGYVRVTDIENRWRDDRTKGLPHGVIESLQKVASHDGLLTFERFCTGLKICLLQNQVKNSCKKSDRHNDVENSVMQKPQTIAQTHRPPSAPLLDIKDTSSHEKNWNVPTKNSESTAQQRTISMPQLLTRKDIPMQELRHNATGSVAKHEHKAYGPPKPPRLEKPSTERQKSSRSNYKPEKSVSDEEVIIEPISHTLEEYRRGLGDGRPAIDTQSSYRRTNRRRREPRRHTLHNGVDYNLLRRMKQIEQEKDALLQGLSAVEEAREWYLKQLSEIQEKMRYAGRMGNYMLPFSSDVSAGFYLPWSRADSF